MKAVVSEYQPIRLTRADGQDQTSNIVRRIDKFYRILYEIKAINMAAVYTTAIKIYLSDIFIPSPIVLSDFTLICRYQTGCSIAPLVAAKDRQKVAWDTREC